VSLRVRKQRRVWLTAILITLASLAFSALSAQSPETPIESPAAATTPGKSPSSAELPSLHFMLEARSEGGKLTSPAAFSLAIQNGTDKVYEIQKIQLMPPDAFKRLRPTTFPWAIDLSENQPKEEPWSPSCRLGAIINARRVLRCDLRAPSVSPSQLGMLFSADAVFFLPADYPVAAVVTYRENVSGKEPLAERVETKLALAPSLTSLMAGGVLGSLLLVLFIGSYRVRQVLQGEGLQQLTWRRGLAFGLRLGSQVLFGSIVAIITIVLIQRVADFELPIRLEISDFLGGIIVGLFSAKLGEALHKRFLG
jgi:hypothetical protein